MFAITKSNLSTWRVSSGTTYRSAWRNILTPHGEYHRRLATYVASGLKVLSQQDEFRFVETIRFGFLGSCKEAFDIELTLAPGKGGDETLHIADILVQSLDIDGLADLHLTVFSNSWRYTAMLYD